MSSTHQRNVHGMHDAPRCEFRAKSGDRCRNPAVRGKRRCAVHGGKRSVGKDYRQEAREASKASLRVDQLVAPQVRKLNKLIRKLQRSGEAAWALRILQEVSSTLDNMTRQKDLDLASDFIVPEAQRTAERKEAARLDLARRYSSKGHRTLESVRDRARGAILGLATGEALGITLVGCERHSYEIENMVGGGRLGLQPGQWAGDTAMALALLECLCHRRQFDESDLIERLIEWRDDGEYSCAGLCVGLGSTTAAALDRYGRTDDPIAGETHADDLSNGSLARVAPVAIRYWRRGMERRDVAERQSRVTHGGPYAIAACVAFADILAGAIAGEPREAVLRLRNVPVPESTRMLNVGSWAGRRRDDVSGANNAITSLEAAMWCVGTTESFEEAVLAAANLGDDAGSTAAIAGQLAGALYGACAIPDRWLELLAWRDKIVDMADAVFDRSAKRG
jgi:ADP-ribosylglycohydrolase